jgi:hypothetical protein
MTSRNKEQYKTGEKHRHILYPIDMVLSVHQTLPSDFNRHATSYRVSLLVSTVPFSTTLSYFSNITCFDPNMMIGID